MTPETLAFLRQKFSEIEERMDAFDDRLRVMETVTEVMRSELDEIVEKAYEDGYLSGSENSDSN